MKRNHIAMMVGIKQEQAVTLRNDIHVVIQPHALRLSLLQMGGEASALWAYVADSELTGMDIWSIEDPRNSKRATELLLRLVENVVLPYMSSCTFNNLTPQIIMANDSSRRALKIMVEKAIRGAFAPNISEEQKNRLLSLNYLVWLSRVLPEKAQPLLISACDLLSAQFALPMPKHNCHHLGACLAWIDPKNYGPSTRASYVVDEEASALVMMPQTELTIIEDVKAFSAAYNAMYFSQKSNKVISMTAKHEVKKRSTKIRAVLERELKRMHSLLRAAFNILAIFPASEGAVMLLNHYTEDYQRNLRRINSADFLNMRELNSPQASISMRRREGINQSADSILQADKLTETWSIASGSIVAAEIISGRLEGKKAFLLLSTSQPIVRVRTDDKLDVKHSLIKSVFVRDKRQAEMGGYFILVEVKHGINSIKKLFKEMRDSELIGNSLLLSKSNQDMKRVNIEASLKYKRVSTINTRLNKLRGESTPAPVDDGENFTEKAESLLMKKGAI